MQKELLLSNLHPEYIFLLEYITSFEKVKLVGINTEYLTLSNNNLDRLDNSMLANLKKLQSLNVCDNKSTINEVNISGLDELTSL